MNDRDSPADERMLEFLVNRFPPAGPPATEACPDPNLLAGLADGTLLPEERRMVERHIAACPVCGRLASDLVRGEAGDVRFATADPGKKGRSGRGRVFTWPRLVVAAALLVGVVLGARALFPPAAPPGVEERLVRDAERLTAARQELFAGFRPLSREERIAPPTVVRGGVAAGFPAGKLLERRPAFRWRPAPGVTQWVVILRRQEGTLVWEERSRDSSLAYPANRPALEPGGKYLWEVSGHGPLGEERAAQAFTVASEEERAAFEAARGEIARIAEPRDVSLLTAHYALRRGLLGEAERAARAAWQKEPDAPVVRETLLHVLRRTRSPDVEWLEKRRSSPIEKH